ncbi:MAG: isopentenyl-diphosphate delta-isomerase [Bacteroidetes bacterium HGW-Bacteroidetes-15]|nr:MAG: isopentenyl-diphosphate delta-isomerase [Bacteroidetes bacterium HGW-Bacteroidetes-15]
MDNLIALVNPNDEVVGFSDKNSVHREGLLHRAFSVFVFNSNGELMLHKRALDKYHSPGLWTNTCCSHLPQGMDMDQACHSRLYEEMGFDTELSYVTKFHYRVEFTNGLIENEIDHIYVGYFNGTPSPNPTEVAGYKWMSLQEISKDIDLNPNNYTYWTKHIFKNHLEELEEALQLMMEDK